MSNFTLLLLFSVVSEFLAVLFFFRPNFIEPIPYGTFTFLFATLICFWLAVSLKRTVSETGDTSLASLLETLRNYFLVMGIFFFLDWFPHVGLPLLYPVDVVASHAHTFAHVFFFIGNAIIIRIPVSFINQGWKNYASFLMGIIGVVTVGWRFLNPDRLVYIFGPDRAPIIITDAASGIFFLIGNGLGLLIPGLYLVYLSMRSMDRTTKVRALLLGLGMAVFFSIGPVIDLIQNQYTQLLIHLLQATSFFLMGASAFYRTGVLSSRTSPATRPA